MNLCLTVMALTNTHKIDDPAKERGRWLKGAVCDVREDRGGDRVKNGHPRLQHVYVSAWPFGLVEAVNYFMEEGTAVRSKRRLDQFTIDQATDLFTNGHLSVTLDELNKRTRSVG